jgi:hypothetical protein
VRGGQLLDGLVRICAEWLGGGSGRPARPLCVFHLDVSRPDLYGLLEQGVRGKAPRLSAVVCAILARDADFRAVIFDGSRPLAVSAKLHAKDVPTDITFAVRARDRGDRFPGSRDPLAFSDIHHIFEDRAERTHDPDTLVHLSRSNHKLTHDRGWDVELDPSSGQVTVKRRGRTWKSLPRGTPLTKPPPKPPPPDDDPTPPGMPF